MRLWIQVVLPEELQKKPLYYRSGLSSLLLSLASNSKVIMLRSFQDHKSVSTFHIRKVCQSIWRYPTSSSLLLQHFATVCQYSGPLYQMPKVDQVLTLRSANGLLHITDAHTFCMCHPKQSMKTPHSAVCKPQHPVQLISTNQDEEPM